MMGPLVSIVTVTFNQERTIARTIESVLAQRVGFPVEYIISDDCSTDGTLAVCRSYQERYPDRIRVISGEKNVGAVANERRAFEAASGKYVATCEGDDYWTDPLKLQMQADFLESHPDYSVCFHRYMKHDCVEDRYEGDGCDFLFRDPDTVGVEISMEQFMRRWVTQYLTMMFRRECYDTSLPDRYRLFRDTHQIYHLLRNGRCFLFSFVGGVYDISGSGVYTAMDSLGQARKVLAVDRELWKVNGDDGWKSMCATVMQDMVDRHRAPYAFRIFVITLNAKKLIKI